MKNFNELEETLNSLKDDAVKFFDKGNSSAGTRLRVGMQKVKNLAQAIRVDVTNAKAGATKKPAPSAAKKVVAKKAVAKKK